MLCTHLLNHRVSRQWQWNHWDNFEQDLRLFFFPFSLLTPFRPSVVLLLIGCFCLLWSSFTNSFNLAVHWPSHSFHQQLSIVLLQDSSTNADHMYLYLYYRNQWTYSNRVITQTHSLVWQQDFDSLTPAINHVRIQNTMCLAMALIYHSHQEFSRLIRPGEWC